VHFSLSLQASKKLMLVRGKKKKEKIRDVGIRKYISKMNLRSHRWSVYRPNGPSLLAPFRGPGGSSLGPDGGAFLPCATPGSGRRVRCRSIHVGWGHRSKWFRVKYLYNLAIIGIIIVSPIFYWITRSVTLGDLSSGDRFRDRHKVLRVPILCIRISAIRSPRAVSEIAILVYLSEELLQKSKTRKQC